MSSDEATREPTHEDTNDDVIDALEALIFGAVGLTAAALSQSGVADLTVIQWRALVIVGRAGKARVTDVATRLGASMTATSRLISRLERRGYVTTAQDENDRRATPVSLTKTGRLVRKLVIKRRRELMVEAISRVDAPLPTDLAVALRELAQRLADYS
jgi:DNA-binding MarR family transcriptional regulator